MLCLHEKRKWVVFDPKGGVIALDDSDDNEGVTHHSSVEWCSECGSIKVENHWIQAGNPEPPWLVVISALMAISHDVEQWKRVGEPLTTTQHRQLALALDHVQRAKGFLERCFGVLPSG